MAIDQGMRLGGRYELVRRIARGGMGEVWEAEDEVLGRRVAAKVIQDSLADDPDFSSRFRHEARLSARLSHPAIATVHDYGSDGGIDYLVMELVPGQSLADLLGRHGALAPAYVVDLLRQAAAGLNAAHDAGVIHRDIKPANILVTPKGQVKLTDFGIARALGEAKMTRTGEVLGTAQYLSPEAALGHDVGPQSDLYSLAVVAYEALSGHRPFRADSGVTLAMQHVNTPPPQLPPTLSPGVRAVVMRGLAKYPAQRQPGADAFARDLMRAQQSAPSTTAPRGPQTGPATPSGPLGAHAWPTQTVTPPPGTPPPHYTPPQQHRPAPGRDRSPSPAALRIGRLWAAAAGLAVLCSFLPWATHEGRHWIAFTLGDAQSLMSGDALGVVIVTLVFAIIFAGLALPQALGRGHLGWSIPACIVGLMTGLLWIGCLAYIDGTTDEPSQTSMGAGAILFPIIGTVAFGFAVASLFKRR